MALGFYFSPNSFSPQQYDDAIKRLEDAGAGAPAGRISHVAFVGDEGDGVHIFDIWESREAFEAFGPTLMPILTELGVDPGTPQVSQVHNTIQG